MLHVADVGNTRTDCIDDVDILVANGFLLCKVTAPSPAPNKCIRNKSVVYSCYFMQQSPS